jgi:hypothetical protein
VYLFILGCLLLVIFKCFFLIFYGFIVHEKKIIFKFHTINLLNFLFSLLVTNILQNLHNMHQKILFVDFLANNLVLTGI